MNEQPSQLEVRKKIVTFRQILSAVRDQNEEYSKEMMQEMRRRWGGYYGKIYLIT